MPLRMTHRGLRGALKVFEATHAFTGNKVAVAGERRGALHVAGALDADAAIDRAVSPLDRTIPVAEAGGGTAIRHGITRGREAAVGREEALHTAPAGLLAARPPPAAVAIVPALARIGRRIGLVGMGGLGWWNLGVGWWNLGVG